MSKADYKQLEQSQQKSESDRVTAAALAPSERKEGDNGDEAQVQAQAAGLTKVPPASAIAGNLIRLWVNGGVDSVELVSKL
jgi:NAD+ diphosphatase